MNRRAPHPSSSLLRRSHAIASLVCALGVTAAPRAHSAPPPPPPAAHTTPAAAPAHRGDELFSAQAPDDTGDALFTSPANDGHDLPANAAAEAPAAAPSEAPVYPQIAITPPPRPAPVAAAAPAARCSAWPAKPHRHPDPDRKPAGYGPTPPPVIRGPATLAYPPGSAIPPGYRPDTHRRRSLLIAGAVTFGTAWLSSAAFAAVIQRAGEDRQLTIRLGDGSVRNEGAPALYAPLVGPFIALGTMEPDLQVGAALVADGLVQATGLGLFAFGLLSREPVLVRIGQADLTVRATITPSGTSVFGVTGSF